MVEIRRPHPRPADEVARERRDLERRLEELRAEVRADPEAGELAGYDQHQADTATEMSMREGALTRIEDLQRRIEALREEELTLARGDEPPRGGGAEPWPGDAAGADDDATPLDAPEEPPVDLGAIPLAGEDADREYDPQEEDDEVLPGAGLAYPEEGGAPAVGRPEDEDARLDREYRPD